MVEIRSPNATYRPGSYDPLNLTMTHVGDSRWWKRLDSIMLTPAMQDYLKTIYRLQQGGTTVSTNLLAEQMQIRPASVGMIKLAELKMVEHTPYYGVSLTSTGQRAALETLRHHRLLELYLTEKLGYSWDEVHEEADRLEHHISERLEARMFAALENPPTTPTGI